jgi:hypothetical protein
MAQLNISSQTSLLNPANNLVFALYDASAPSVLLESQAPPKPYGNPLQVTFLHNCINGHVYIFELWESADTTPTGAVRNSMNITVNGNTVNVRTDEYLEADVTTGMVAGTNTYNKADYENWEYDIERIGQGTMTPNFAPDITQPQYKRTNNDDTPNDLGSKITLLTTDDTWQPNEKFVVRFLPQVVVAPPPGTPSGLFGEGRVITADENLNAADLGKALLLQSASSTLNIGLPSLASVSDFSFIYLFSTGGNHINASVTADGSDTILYPTALASIILGQCETAIIYKAFGVWNVLTDLNGVKQVGELIYNYLQTEINTIICAGQLLLRAEYPRLWAFVQSLNSASLVTDTAWTATTTVVNGVTYYTKKGCFSTGDGSTTFRVPLLTNSFLRGVNGSSRYPGPLEIQTIGKHGHNVKTGGFSGGADPGKSLVRINYNGDAYQAGASSGGPYIEVTGDEENKPTNTGVFLLMRI